MSTLTVMTILFALAVLSIIRACYIRVIRKKIGHSSLTTTSKGLFQWSSVRCWFPEKIRWGWIILILLLLPIIWPAAKFVGLAWVAGMDYNTRGTHPTDWGVWKKPSPRPVQIAPEKLLQWNADAKVKMRRQSTAEMAHNGICFVDFIPPDTRPEYQIECSPSSNGLPYQTYLVQHDVYGFRNPWELAQRAVSRENVRDGIILIEQLSGNGILKHDLFIRNHTGGGQEAPILCEEYLQFADQASHEVIMTRAPDARNGIYQYVTEVMMDESSFIVQDNRFKWLWIAPVHCKDWQLQIGETSVPSKGIDEGAREMFKGLKGDNSSIAPFAITVNVGDKEVPLEKAVLLEPRDMGSGKVTLRVNAPHGKWLEGKLKPAKIIVGYQL